MLSITLFFLAIPVTFQNYYKNDFEKSKYDFIITGPITNDLYNKLKKHKNVTDYSAAFDVRALASDNYALQVYLVDNLTRFSRVTFYQKSLLLKGNYTKGQAVISNDIANRLNLDIGNKFNVIINKKNIVSVYLE